MSIFDIALLAVFALLGAISYYRFRDVLDRADDLMAVTETEHINLFWKVVLVICGVLAAAFYFWFKYMLWKSK
jgi:multisubunit Na+/H+ antiporter MnhG subunit